MNVDFDDYTLDGNRHQLLRSGEPVHLSPKAFDLLALLIAGTPRALSRGDLHQQIWPDTFVTDANLAGLVAELRAALGDDARQPRFIRTVQRFGYAFCCAVRPAASHEASAWLTCGGAERPLRAGRNVIGRGRGADVQLDHPSISRRHAVITVVQNAATLEDLGSKNGTSVATVPVSGVVLIPDGSEIVFGVLEARFHFRPSGSSTFTMKR
jgi:DNA-binding winged helix-turn-helix (wHTH) protein